MKQYESEELPRRFRGSRNPLNCSALADAIAVMERAKERDSCYMPAWQKGSDGRHQDDEAMFHACGNTACFAGHLAIAPEFQIRGMRPGIGGAPVLPGGEDGAPAVAQLLNISERLAGLFVYGDTDDSHHVAALDYSRFYGKRWGQVKAEDVLAKLRELQKFGYCTHEGERFY